VTRRRTTVRRVTRIIRNRLARRSYARAVAGVDEVPVGSYVVFFAAVPDEIYQVEQWQHVLRVVARRRDVFVLAGSPDVGRLVLERTGLPVVFSAGGRDLERLVTSRRPAAILYLNHRQSNFAMLRYPETVHIYLGHGESDKGSSASHQNMAYDYCFVAGQAAQDRLAAALPLFDVQRRAPRVGRPNLDPEVLGHERPEWAVDAPGRSTVLYAPTWEGGLPSMAVGSVVSHGEALVRSVLADPTLRLIYRPHPLTGSVAREHAAADERIRRAVSAAGLPHLVDTGPYGWVFAVADLAVVDVSSVAYDWLATGRGLIITQPADKRARPTPSRLLDVAPTLAASDADRAATRLRQLLGEPEPGWADLVEYYVGDTSPGASIGSFLEALAAVAVGPTDLG
jgi:CDP-Glycerol:Poly(glycerophosphate) glycerophosphotransferase